MYKTTLLLALCFSATAFAQNKTIFTPDSIDSVYGITYYAKYNDQLGGTEQRQCNGAPCNEYVTDLYASGEKLHKGYYQNGTLRIFKNFYPNGAVEREFRWIDDHKCSIKMYYPSGNIKSKVKYVDGNPVSWEDYYDNGNPDYIEQFDNDFEYYIKQYSYNTDGSPLYLMDLKKKGQKIYHKQEFENGVLRAEGPVKYSIYLHTYFQTDWWTVYDASGKAIKRLEYEQGKVVTEEEVKS